MQPAASKWPFVPAGALLALFAGLAIGSASGNAVTGDEVAHLPAGYTYELTWFYR